jgi:hypothetical protein
MSSENETVLPPVPPVEEENIIPGDFEYVKDRHSREMLVNAWQAITLTEMWNYIKQDIDSFMFSNDPRIWSIHKKMEKLGYDGHSGASFGWVMRTMQYIANHGEKKYKEIVNEYS